MMAQKRSRREFEQEQRRKQEAPFVIYGTPLPLRDDSARDDGTYLPVWKQEVVDDRGRKRLHGAFTGGFSAGYFNTVGSKEGWTPSTFVSSRSNRAKDAPKRAEDFMDDEDLRERDETQTIETAPGFGFAENGPKDALEELFGLNEQSIGEQLLQRMGWKKGQGIGPRIMRRIDPGDESSEMREFPPEDTAVVDYPQHDTKGMGHGEKSAAIVRSLPTNPGTLQKRRPAGIGVGALNDTGSDDDDPFELGPRVSLPSSKSKKSKKSTSIVKSKKSKLPSMLGSSRKCHDGKLPLNGFVLAEPTDMSKLSIADTAPLIVPEEWTPRTQGPFTKPQTRIAEEPLTQTAESRRHLLQEPALPSKSVFDFLSPAARDRLAQASGKTDLPPALNEAPVQTKSKGLDYPQLDHATAVAALARLKHKHAPYEADLARQGRYKDFLRYKIEANDVLPLRAPDATDTEHLAELDEFVATAGLFRPVAGFLGSKFTSSTEGPKSERVVVKDPAEEAARMGMFGAATRSERNWMPTRLVCKRFGVDVPVNLD